MIQVNSGPGGAQFLEVRSDELTMLQENSEVASANETCGRFVRQEVRQASSKCISSGEETMFEHDTWPYAEILQVGVDLKLLRGPNVANS